jgi:hypothetical protein
MHTVTIQILAPDYVKARGFAIVRDELRPIMAVFKGEHARTLASDWLDGMQHHNETGEVEARYIVRGQLSDHTIARCALTVALYGPTH